MFATEERANSVFTTRRRTGDWSQSVIGRRCHAPVDAIVEQPTDSTEFAEERPATRRELAHQFLCLIPPLIAPADQLLVRRCQLLQTIFKRLESRLQHGLTLLALAAQALDEISVQVTNVALVSLALFEDLQIRETIGPGQERFVGVIFRELAVQCHARFLEHIPGVLFVRKQRENVAKQLFLVPGEEA